MDQPNLGDDPRFATRAARATHAVELNALVACWSSVHSKADLTSLLGGEVPYGPMNTIADITNDPHVAARGMLAKVAAAGKEPWTIAAKPFAIRGSWSRPVVIPSTTWWGQQFVGNDHRIQRSGCRRQMRAA